MNRADLVRWACAQAREPSTWRGLVWMLTAAGISISPEIAVHLGATGMAIAGLIGALFPDRPR